MEKLLHFLSPYKKRLTLMLLLLFLQVLGTLYIPTLTAGMVNNGIIQGDLDYVWKTSGFMLMVALVTASVSIFGTYLSTYISTGMGRDIRGALFRKTQAFSANNFNQFGAASLITRSTNDVSQVQQAFSAIVEMLLPAPFMTVAGLVLAFSKNRELALIILGLMLFIFIMTITLGKRVVPIFDTMQTMLDTINRTVRESIIGVRVIRAFNRTQDDKKRVNNAFTDYANIAIKANKIFAILMPLVMLFMNIGTILIIWFGGKQAAAGNIGIGDIMAIIEYAMITLMYLVMGGAVFLFIPRAQTCANRIDEVLKMQPEFSTSVSEISTRTMDKKTYAKVEFRNVTFQYADAEEAVLHNIDFMVETGKTTAIIGSTGSGKSTIASLIMRFYDIAEGNILVDGKDVRDYLQGELRSKVGYVPQEAFLFSGTIADNLRHGKKDATIEEMRHAVKVAQIDDFIENVANGFNHTGSQDGSNI